MECAAWRSALGRLPDFWNGSQRASTLLGSLETLPTSDISYTRHAAGVSAPGGAIFSCLSPIRNCLRVRRAFRGESRHVHGREDKYGRLESCVCNAAGLYRLFTPCGME
jgi:hypothetical protein